MAYRLRQNESVRKGLDRILKKELRSAAEQLETPSTSEKAVLEARKSIKKSRAALRLVRINLSGVRKRDMKRLRHGGRLLSRVRDADAMVQTARDLCRRYGGRLSGRSCAAIQVCLTERGMRVKEKARRQRRAAAVAKTLRSLRRTAGTWRLKRSGFSAMAKGFKQTYREARAAMARARATRRSADFHEWRKRVKGLWYHVRLLEERAPTLRGVRERLKRIADALGEEHNLQLFRRQLARGRSNRPPQPELDRLLALSEQRQREMQTTALRIGLEMFKDKPRGFVQKLRTAWRFHSKSRARRPLSLSA